MIPEELIRNQLEQTIETTAGQGLSGRIQGKVRDS